MKIKQKNWVKENNQEVIIVRKIGNWDIGLIRHNDKVPHLMIRGLDYGENPIIYSNKREVAYNYPERIPDSVKKYIINNADKLYDLVYNENIKVTKDYMSNRMEKRKW